MAKFTRRDFLRGSAAAVGLASGLGGARIARAAKRSATDWVALGKSGVQVTRLAMGSGGNGGRMQREMGQAAFTRVVRHAYDRGIRFFESADAYGTHPLLAEALRGISRDSYRLMTKMPWQNAKDVPGTIDRFRRELNSEYFDILLLHCVTEAGWPNTLEPLRDAFSEAKGKKIILAHGASCHGLKPLADFPGNHWLDVSLNRVNHNGTKMDGPTGGWNEIGDVPQVVSQLKKVHAQGTGVIGMKLIGNGSFTKADDRDASIKFVMNLDCVDAVTIGLLSESQVDEAIERMNTHLNA